MSAAKTGRVRRGSEQRSPEKKNQKNSPEGHDNNKGDANGFQEETAHSCPDHNQWRTEFEVEVLVADKLTLSLHASPLESPASPARLQASTTASSQETFEQLLSSVEDGSRRRKAARPAIKWSSSF